MRRVATALALAAATALAAAGCAKDDQTVRTGGPGDEPTKKQTRFEKRAEAIENTWPERLKPLTGRPDALLPLENAERPDPDSRTITVIVGHGACDKDWGAHLHETDDLVIVAGWKKEDKNVDFCTEQLVTDKVKVKLDEKFGDRTLVDAATGRQLPHEKE
ncbi:hypothetical protein [Streptomyces alkaliterrae]|uniref:Lipoprotein n=1 Tax=Streptomyces alkaliterrae TaxID=2213162 RepID=A0A5P0YN82_9ACTN|nr:hypothetical protein [Streptomyces alkaliterrae]MBB1259206.1 hypothetical protein [Streptomyces alkaliterrae]MQS01380.1 hypothetical protein [Streptomyces alkaliterrae]